MIDLNKLINEARKEHNTVNLVAYQNLKAEQQKYETSKGAKPLTDTKQLEIFAKYAKSLEDSIRQFKEAGRRDLELGYIVELEVVKQLLPEPITAEKLQEFIESDVEFFDPFWTIVEDYSGGTEYTHMELRIPKKEMGASIKRLKTKFPTADGKMISDVVKSYLA